MCELAVGSLAGNGVDGVKSAGVVMAAGSGFGGADPAIVDAGSGALGGVTLWGVVCGRKVVALAIHPNGPPIYVQNEGDRLQGSPFLDVHHMLIRLLVLAHQQGKRSRPGRAGGGVRLVSGLRLLIRCYQNDESEENADAVKRASHGGGGNGGSGG